MKVAREAPNNCIVDIKALALPKFLETCIIARAIEFDIANGADMKKIMQGVNMYQKLVFPCSVKRQSRTAAKSIVEFPIAIRVVNLIFLTS